MSLFNRITATFAATVDKAVSQVENHEAIIDAALTDTKRSVAKARVRLARVNKDGDSLQHKLQQLKTMETTWVERARHSAEQDEQKALLCVQRRNVCREQILQTQQALAQHEALVLKVSESVERMEQRLGSLTQQRNMMRSRHSAADAMRVINAIEGDADVGIDDTFDRWEVLITETEYMAGATAPVDTLDASFSRLENTQALRADLDELLDAAASSHKNNISEG